MVELSIATVSKFLLSDALLLGFAWEQDGRDVRLDLATGDGLPATLRCTWVRGLQIDLRYADDSGGQPLSFECEVRGEENAWTLLLDFPPNGYITLTCDQAFLEQIVGS